MLSVRSLTRDMHIFSDCCTPRSRSPGADGVDAMTGLDILMMMAAALLI